MSLLPEQVLRHGTFSWPEMHAFWAACPSCGKGSHFRVSSNEMSQIVIVGAPGPEWREVRTIAVQDLFVRVDPSFLHVWLGATHYEFPAKASNISFKADGFAAA
jgi:hypothetical protein